MNKYTKQAQAEWLSGKDWEDKRAIEVKDLHEACVILFAMICYLVLNGAADWVVGL